MANGTLVRDSRPANPSGQKGGGAGLALLGAGAIGLLGFGAYELLKSKSGSSSSPVECPGAVFTDAGTAYCIPGMPAGSLVQDPTSTISIVNAQGQRQGFTDLSLVQACGYDLDRLVQISGIRREAIPLGAVISQTGICPTQSSEESPPVGL